MALWEDILSSGYTDAIIMFLGFFVGAVVIDFFMKRYGERIKEKTGSDTLSEIFDIIHRPVYWLLIITGLLLSVTTANFTEQATMWSNRILFVFHALMVSYILSRISSVLITSWIKVTKKYEKTPQLINKIISIVIYVIAILVVLDHFEIEISPIIATLGLGGLAVGLALQDTLKDLFAGLHIISDRPIRVGDFIELEGATNQLGYVQDIGWRSTRVKTLSGNYVILPNSKLAASTIINDSMPDRSMLFFFEVGVDYGSDLDKVEKVARKVAEKVQKSGEGTVDDYEPGVRFFEFADSNINFRIVLKIKEYTDKFPVRNMLMKELHKAFKKEDIEISWPVRKIYNME